MNPPDIPLFDWPDDSDLPDVPNAETNEPAFLDEDDGEIITCWCGAQGTFSQLFSREPFQETCGGTQYLDCHCGGDQCVCHHHGQEIECPGCVECRGDDQADYDDDCDDYDPYEDVADCFKEDEYP